MAAIALIQFTQGFNVGAAGEAMLGEANTLVSIANNSPVDIQSWKIDLVYVPPGSAVSIGTLASGNSNTPAASFTPDDVPGCYRVVLTVWTGVGQTGTSNKDIRCFAVPDTSELILPPYQQLPAKLPVLGSGLPGEKPDELNFFGQTYGWSGSGDDGLLLDFIRQASAVLPVAGVEWPGSGPGGESQKSLIALATGDFDFDVSTQPNNTLALIRFSYVAFKTSGDGGFEVAHQGILLALRADDGTLHCDINSLAYINAGRNSPIDGITSVTTPDSDTVRATITGRNNTSRIFLRYAIAFVDAGSAVAAPP
jgi:hypothetical protein